jgi:thiol-disulfide isomerase/thioredoxin
MSVRSLFILFIGIFLYFPTILPAAEPVVLQQLHGEPLLFSSLKGRWVFINYWASWCGPCLDEIPELNRFYARNKRSAIALFGVNYDGLSIQEQTDLAIQFQLAYPSLSHDPAQDLHLKDIQVLPITFVFNPKGELHKTLYGEQTAAQLTAYLETHRKHAS